MDFKFHARFEIVWIFSWDNLDVAQAAEAIQMLTTIIKFRTTQNPNAVKNAIFVLAKVYFSASQMEKAKDFGNRALDGKNKKCFSRISLSLLINSL
jgi:hypothetical protein